MYISQSLIPFSGKGLFTSDAIKKGQIIGEYYGYFLKDDEESPPEQELYLFSTYEGKTIVPDDQCIFRYVNDAIDLDAAIVEILPWIIDKHKAPKKSILDAIEIVCDPIPPCFIDEPIGILCQYNLKWIEKDERVFLKAIRDIGEDEELYIYYGWEYWSEILLKKIRELIIK